MIDASRLGSRHPAWVTRCTRSRTRLESSICPNEGSFTTTSRHEDTHVSSRYEIRLRGRLTRSLTSEFRRFDLTVAEVPVETMLDGDFADQSALYGILRFIEDLGLEIVEVRRVRAAVETMS
jgi:hypothetical protein